MAKQIMKFYFKNKKLVICYGFKRSEKIYEQNCLLRYRPDKYRWLQYSGFLFNCLYFKKIQEKSVFLLGRTKRYNLQKVGDDCST